MKVLFIGGPSDGERLEMPDLEVRQHAALTSVFNTGLTDAIYTLNRFMDGNQMEYFAYFHSSIKGYVMKALIDGYRKPERELFATDLQRQVDALRVVNRELKEAVGYNRMMAADYGEELLKLRSENLKLKEALRYVQEMHHEGDGEFNDVVTKALRA